MKMRSVLKKVVWRLLVERQISYRWLRVEFDLDDTKLEALRHELIIVRGMGNGPGWRISGLAWWPRCRTAIGCVDIPTLKVADRERRCSI